MVVVVVGVLDQVVLVILLGAHPGGRRLDPGDDRLFLFVGFVDLCFDCLCGFVLGF